MGWSWRDQVAFLDKNEVPLLTRKERSSGLRACERLLALLRLVQGQITTPDLAGLPGPRTAEIGHGKEGPPNQAKGPADPFPGPRGPWKTETHHLYIKDRRVGLGCRASQTMSPHSRQGSGGGNASFRLGSAGPSICSSSTAHHQPKVERLYHALDKTEPEPSCVSGKRA